MAKKTYLFFVVIMFSGISLFAQSELSVEKIMRDPVWMGSFPENPRWSEDSRYIYFERNPENNPYNSVYKYDVESGETTQLSIEEEKKLIPCAIHPWTPAIHQSWDRIKYFTTWINALEEGITSRIKINF